MKKYKLQSLIDNGLDLTKLDKDTKENIELAKAASEKWTIEDPDARAIDELGHAAIMKSFPDAIKKSPTPAPQKKDISDSDRIKIKKIRNLSIKHLGTDIGTNLTHAKILEISKGKSALEFTHWYQEYFKLTANPPLPSVKKTQGSFEKGMSKLDECRQLIAEERKQKTAAEPPKAKPQERTLFKEAGQSYAGRVFSLVKKQEEPVSLAKRVKTLMIRQEVQMNELVFGQSISDQDKNAIETAIEEKFESIFQALIDKVAK